eukprot:m.151012 g.151012  ORF g.151012 m.151012 type:complete len:732 (+) comp23346_c0_seq1:16-2211(+)
MLGRNGGRHSHHVESHLMAGAPAAVVDDNSNELLDELLDEEDEDLPEDLLELNESFVKAILQMHNYTGDTKDEREDEFQILLDTIAFVFNEEDTDDDGEINIEELGTLFEKIGRKRPSPDVMLELFEKVKVDGDLEGEIRYREFVNMMLLDRGVISSPIHNLEIDVKPSRRSTAFFGGRRIIGKVTQLLVGGEEDEVSEAEAQRLRLQMIKRGQIRVQVYLEEGVVKVLIGEAQGLRVNIRGLPSPFAKCHYEHDSIDKGVAAKTNEAPGTANPIWGERLELPLPKLIKDVRLCITVLHRENTGALRGIAGAKDLFVGMVSFPMEQVLDTGYAGWFRLLDERDGGGVVVPLRKVRVSHRIVSTTEERAAVIDDYVFGKLLGEGAYGKVYLAQEDSTKEVYAVKVLSKMAMAEMDHDMALIERRALTIHPSSPFLATLRASFQSDAYVFMVLDFYHGGDLEGHMIKDGHRKIFSPEVVRFVAAQILLGLWHLHHVGYMYRDLKPANIMLDSNGMAKISDFGLSKLVGSHGKTETFVGTPNYMAPEIVRNSPDYEGTSRADRAPYGMEADFWSLGVMLKEMLTGRTPWEGAEQRGVNTIFRKILHEPVVMGPLPRALKREWVKKCTTLLKRFLVRDPMKRISSELQVRGLDFFKGFRWDEMERLKMEPPGRMFVPDIDRFYFVPEGDGKVSLDPVDDDDLADIKRHEQFFSGFDYVPGTVEEQIVDEAELAAE